MKKLIIIAFILHSLTPFAQLDDQTQHKVDSLRVLIQSAKHDSSKISIRKNLSKILRRSNYNLEIQNQKKIIEIATNGIKHQDLSRYYRNELANAYMNLGVTYKMKGVSDSSIHVYMKSEQHFLKLNDTLNLMRVYGNSGNAYLNLNRLEKAVEYYEKCLKKADQLDNKRAIGYTYIGLGVVYKEQGDFNSAIINYYEALEIVDELGDSSAIGSVTANIALIHKLMGNYSEAINKYKYTIKLYKQIGKNSGLATAYNNLGNVYENQFKIDSALYFYKLSLEIREKLNDVKGIAGCYSNMSNAFGQKKEFDKSVSYLKKSLEIREGIKDYKGTSIALNNLASIYVKQKKYSKAIATIKKSQSIGKSVLTQPERLSQAYILYESYKNLNNEKFALKNYEAYINIRDSINDETNQKEVIRQEYKYQYEKQAAADSVKAAEAAKVKDAQLSAEKAENKRHQIEAKQQRQQKYFLYGGLVLALIFGGFIFNRFQVTRKQKGVIEEQKEKVDVAYEQLGEKNQEILDSINYAKRIQSAILPPQKLVKEFIPESFILYKPKDIVAGDFYWMEPQKDGVIFAAADCTGHGVPGAMVSVVCNNGLNRSVREHGLKDPAKILDKTREIVIAEFEKSEEEVKDGMDIALCTLNSHSDSHSVLQYAGAHNPLWILRKGAEEIEVIKADNQPIGKFGAEQPFTNHTIELQKGDSIYIFSDGYPDQFGGPKGKKFKYKSLKNLLIENKDKTMEEIKDILDDTFLSWKGDLEQLDDVCVIGIRV